MPHIKHKKEGKIERLPRLHFKIKEYYSDGQKSWTAQCVEIGGIITGSVGEVDPILIYDAVTTALGYGVFIPRKYLD